MHNEAVLPIPRMLYPCQKGSLATPAVHAEESSNVEICECCLQRHNMKGVLISIFINLPSHEKLKLNVSNFPVLEEYYKTETNLKPVSISSSPKKDKRLESKILISIYSGAYLVKSHTNR
jgi:hypothetical protein